MSQYSGKCDLFDHMSGMGGWFDKDGNPVELNDPNYYGPYYSDELKDFEAFKKATKGILHQSYLINVTPYNLDFVKSHCKNFTYDVIDELKDDRRTKSGKKLIKKYIYKYYNEFYFNLKDLNKRGVFVNIEIKFDTIYDLIPYYPYIVRVSACCDDNHYIEIHNESYVDEHFKEMLNYGYCSVIDYKKELQEHYIEVFKLLGEK